MSKKIKNFEEACASLGLDPAKVLPDVSKMPESDRKAIMAFAKMCIIQKVLNGDWKPDWANIDQPKYYPWFDVIQKDESGSGFGLSFIVYDFGYSNAFCGARLFYPDSETAKYAGKTFADLYEDMILLPK